MKTFIVLGLYALSVIGATALSAQYVSPNKGTRLDKHVGDLWRNPFDPGNFGSTDSFKNNSVGTTPPDKYGEPTTNIIGVRASNLAPSGTFNYSSLGAKPSGSTMQGMMPGAAAGDVFYKGLSSNLQEVSGLGAVGTLLQRRSGLWLSQGYNHADHRLNNKEDRDPIKTLVPAGEGLYHDYLESGEKAFRGGDYTLAFSKFRMANYIGQKDPESLLSMSQAQFGGKCYPLAAYYLRQALRSMPRLPMVPLQPKAFYGDPSVYVQNVQDLDEYLVGHPQDTDALLLRAYYAWFDVDEADSVGIARNSLQKALAGNNTPDVTLAIEAFWEGMTATGRAKGPLIKPQPEPKAAQGDKKS